jgi:hypothetical protein
VTRFVDVPAATGLTMMDIQQIMDSLLPDVPPGSWPLPGRRDKSEGLGRNRLMVVDRDAFALEVARQRVRAGIPRAPLDEIPAYTTRDCWGQCCIWAHRGHRRPQETRS